MSRASLVALLLMVTGLPIQATADQGATPELVFLPDNVMTTRGAAFDVAFRLDNASAPMTFSLSSRFPNFELHRLPPTPEGKPLELSPANGTISPGEIRILHVRIPEDASVGIYGIGGSPGCGSCLEISVGSGLVEMASPATVPHVRPGEATVRLGANATHTAKFFFQNLGEKNEVFPVAIRQVLGWNITLPPIQLDANASNVFEMGVTTTANPRDGTAVIGIGDPRAYTRIRLDLRYEASASLVFQFDPPRIETTTRDPGRTQVTITNVGDARATGNVTAYVSGGFSTNTRVGDYDLPPGHSTVLYLSVRPANFYQRQEKELGSTGRVELRAGPDAHTVAPDNVDATIEVFVGEHASFPPGSATVDDPILRSTPASLLPVYLAASLGLAALATFAAHRRFPLAFAALYARLAPARLFDHPARVAIRATVAAGPGIGVLELQRATGLARGALDHHTRKLEAAGLLVSVPDGQMRRFYPPTESHPGGRNPLQDEILRALASGERDAAQLARDLGVSRQALHYHLRRLARDGAIAASRRGRALMLRRSGG